MGVKGSLLDGGELDGDDCIEDEGGEEDMGVDEREVGMGTSCRLALTVTVGEVLREVKA